MKAIVYSGDVLKLEEIEKPVPADDEVLIKVRAASINPLDYYFLRHALVPQNSSASKSDSRKKAQKAQTIFLKTL